MVGNNRHYSGAGQEERAPELIGQVAVPSDYKDRPRDKEGYEGGAIAVETLCLPHLLRHRPDAIGEQGDDKPCLPAVLDGSHRRHRGPAMGSRGGGEGKGEELGYPGRKKRFPRHTLSAGKVVRFSIRKGHRSSCEY